jgi:hypothetical protein
MTASKKTPTPRDCHFYGTVVKGHVQKDGTWLEDEAFCYPNGGMTRRAYATCEDGKKRVIKCGIPDTFFSIPGYYKRDGKRVQGFLSSNDEGGLKFTEYKSEQAGE